LLDETHRAGVPLNLAAPSMVRCVLDQFESRVRRRVDAVRIYGCFARLESGQNVEVRIPSPKIHLLNQTSSERLN
jgi:hypothetical protein